MLQIVMKALKHRVGRIQDLVIPESNNCVSQLFKPVLPHPIFKLGRQVNVTVHLDHESKRRTEEVHDEPVQGVLPQEGEAVSTVAA
jgi:hypothetical protein